MVLDTQDGDILILFLSGGTIPIIMDTDGTTGVTTTILIAMDGITLIMVTTTITITIVLAVITIVLMHQAEEVLP